MYGIRAYLIFVAFLLVAAVLLSALFLDWRKKPRTPGGKSKLIGITIFVMLWFGLISSAYISKVRFHYSLRTLSASGVQSIQIGKHDFRDRQSIEELVGALRGSHWFEVNHGGWGNSIPLTVRTNSGSEIVIDVAKYFREPGAIIGPANPRGLGYSRTQAFAPELSQALQKYGVELPDCDTPHGKPCSADQLNP